MWPLPILQSTQRVITQREVCCVNFLSATFPFLFSVNECLVFVGMDHFASEGAEGQSREKLTGAAGLTSSLAIVMLSCTSPKTVGWTK